MSSQTTRTLPKCPECAGEGEVMMPCPTCNGSGKNPNTDEDCNDCDVSSNEVPGKCNSCDGSGIIKKQDLKIVLRNIKYKIGEIECLLNRINDFISEDDLEYIIDIGNYLENIVESSDFHELKDLV